jgi:UDP-glucose 4-epimerase
MAQSEFFGKSVIITGGVGFIGSHLARELVNQGASVTLIDSMVPEYGGNLHNISDIQDAVRVNFSDIRDEHSLGYLLDGADYVFNLAGQTSHMDSMAHPATDLEINVTAQLKLLETLRLVSPHARVVFASTRQIYGKPQFLPVTEDHPLVPVDINGIHKIAGESYHSLYHEVYGIPTTSLRLTNTYGPGMRIKDARQTFVGIWIRLAVQGEQFAVFGDGTQRRDFTYVDDVVGAFLAVATNDNAIGKTYNLGHSEVVSLAQLAELVVSLAPGSSSRTIEFPPDRKAIDIGDYYGDFSLITADVGWEPTVVLSEGLATTLAYYRDHLDHYVGKEVPAHD